MQEPVWLSRQVVEIVHREQLAEHGGRAGLRDAHALEAALARPRQRHVYDPTAKLPRLAAALCIGLARGHPFVDGNKRVALLATYTFLALNGRMLEADDLELAGVIEAVAAGEMTETRLTSWLDAHSGAAGS